MLVQRIAISDDETSSLSVPLLHMAKIFLLSEAVCIQQSEKLVDLISSSIDCEYDAIGAIFHVASAYDLYYYPLAIFIVLDKFDDTDIACCQIVKSSMIWDVVVQILICMYLLDIKENSRLLTTGICLYIHSSNMHSDSKDHSVVEHIMLWQRDCTHPRRRCRQLH